jgi:tryptophan synthase alpha chain
MSNIQKAFMHGKAFIGFVTGGDPTEAKSCEIILQMAEAGADLIEIGIPFSDPIAEGPVIQAANIRALASGCTVDSIFRIVETVRKKIETPLVLLTYLNPVYHYGYDAFFARCAQTGVDGIIIPDLPYEEKNELSGVTAAHGVDLISLIAPTSASRIREIAADAKGFLYLVSSMGVTGVRSEITTDLSTMVELARSVCPVPIAIGFGISTPTQAAMLANIADGVIVGSAIVKIVETYGEQAAGPVYDVHHVHERCHQSSPRC